MIAKEKRPDEVILQSIESAVAVKRKSSVQVPPVTPSVPKGIDSVNQPATEVADSPTTVETPSNKENQMTESLHTSLLKPANVVTKPAEEKQVSLERTQHKVAIYGCGGMGVNMAKVLNQHYAQQAPSKGRAFLETYYVDTSTSNLEGIEDQDHVYLIPNKDGSGQKRSMNASSINERIKEIVRGFKPADLNIVISSGSGGSGSVLAPLISRELVRSKAPVIIITVGDRSTRKFTENTVGTLKSFEAMTKGSDARPFVMSYFENKGAQSRKEVDAKIFGVVEALLVLFSGNNEELDSQDLYHWLNYQEVTDANVQLSNLVVTSGNTPIDEDLYGGPIAVATMAGSHEVSDFNGVVDYQCIGILPKEVEALADTAMHFVITDGYFDKVIAELDKELAQIDEVKNARVSRTSLVDKNTEIDEETGLVF